MAQGRKTGGGSRKGKPNKNMHELRSLVLGALEDVGGQKYLAKQAQENPGPFMALIGKCLPKDIKLDAEVNAKVSIVIKRFTEARG